MSEVNNTFEGGERVEFEGYAHRFRGVVVGKVPRLSNTYYVRSKECEVRMFEGRALTRIERQTDQS